MTKVVINISLGGFNISTEAMKRYCELKNIPCFPEVAKNSYYNIYWTVPPEERGALLSEEEWKLAGPNARLIDMQLANSMRIFPQDIKRHDPVLVQVVEELGELADGPYSKLKVMDIYPDTQYRIIEEAGQETIETPDEVMWETIP